MPRQFADDGLDSSRRLLGHPPSILSGRSEQQSLSSLSNSGPFTSTHEINSIAQLYEVLGLKNGQKIVDPAGKQYRINIPTAKEAPLSPSNLPVIQEEVPFAFADSVTNQAKQPPPVPQSSEDSLFERADSSLSMGDPQSKDHQPLLAARDEQEEDLDDFYAKLAQDIAAQIPDKRQPSRELVQSAQNSYNLTFHQNDLPRVSSQVRDGEASIDQKRACFGGELRLCSMGSSIKSQNPAENQPIANVKSPSCQSPLNKQVFKQSTNALFRKKQKSTETQTQRLFFQSMMEIVKKSISQLQPAASFSSIRAVQEELRMNSSSGEDEPSIVADAQIRYDVKEKIKSKVDQFAKEMGVAPDKLGIKISSPELAGGSVVSPNFVIKTKLQLTLVKSLLKYTFAETDKQKGALSQIQGRVMRKIDKFQTLFDKMQQKTKRLHLAFLFACPLVMSYQVPESTHAKYKLIPPLNHEREFEKIAQRLTLANARVQVCQRQCSIDNLKCVLQDQPIGIHFSGHGILNSVESVGTYHYLHRDEGDFLLMETAEGDSQLVSRKQLQSLITSTGTVLSFVFIATCHSEFVGRIFVEAGAKHVICIEQEAEVMDDAVISFTDTFYDMILRQTVPIPEAFAKAQLVVNISYGEREGKIFKLLNNESTRGQDAEEMCFGPFDEGRWIHNDIDVVLSSLPQRVPNFFGRQKDMFKLICKVMENESSRLLTLVGLPGVGKTALVRNTMHHICERRLLRGGCISSNAQNIQDCEVFIKKLIAQILLQTKDRPEFKSLQQSLAHSHQMFDRLNCLLQVISHLPGKVVLIIDNAEDLVQNDKINFRNLVRLVLLSCQNIKVILTSRVRLSSLPEITEEIIMLGELTPFASWQLFKQMTREIPQREIQDLLALNQKPTTKVYEHHMFKLLGGNPQAIILTAPLLADPDKALTLSSLYEMMTQKQVTQLLRDDQISERMLSSLNVCLQISMQILIESEPVCLKLFFMLGMLPGGATMQELSELWQSLEEPTPLSQVLEQLESYQLIESVHKQSTDETKLLLNKFVAAFAEAMIEERQKEHFHTLIVAQMHRGMRQHYHSICNVKATAVQSPEHIKKAIVSCEQNLWSIIQRMSEKYALASKMLQSPSVSNKGNEWGLLRQATENAIVRQRQLQVIERLQQAVKDKVENIRPRDAVNPHERARLWWRLACGKVKLQVEQKKRNQVKLWLDQHSESSLTDSDFSDFAESSTLQAPKIMISADEHSQTPKIRPNQLGNLNDFTQSQDLASPLVPNQIKTLLRTQTALRINQCLQDIQRQMDKQVEQQQQSSMISGDLGGNRDLMTTSEQLICFYIFSLAMLKQYVIGLRIIKKFLVKFTECSPIFLGNVMRAKALCCEMLLQINGEKNFDPVFDALSKAIAYFKTNEWGLGLCQFQIACTYHFKCSDPQRSKNHYLASIRHFTKCNHFRGVALCYKNLSKATRAQKNCDESLAQRYWDFYLDYQLKWRSSQLSDPYLVSVQRVPGDEFSLLHEIVLYSSLQSRHKDQSFEQRRIDEESILSQSSLSVLPLSSGGKRQSRGSSQHLLELRVVPLLAAQDDHLLNTDVKQLMLESNASQQLNKVFKTSKGFSSIMQPIRKQQQSATIKDVLYKHQLDDVGLSPIKQNEFQRICGDTSMPLTEMTLTFKPSDTSFGSFQSTEHFKRPQHYKRDIWRP